MRQRPRPPTAPRISHREPDYEVIALEPRLMLLAVFNGTNGADEITIARGRFNQGFAVIMNGVLTFTDDSSARVDARGGNDTVLIASVGGATGTRADLTIDLGGGDDLLANTGPLRSMIYSPVVIGGDGDDTLALDNSAFPHALGFCFDTFGTSWEVLVGDATDDPSQPGFRYASSLEHITLDGGPGADGVLLLHKPPTLTLTANGRGGDDSFAVGGFEPEHRIGSITIPERSINFSSPELGWVFGTTTLTGGDNGADRITFHDRRAGGDLPYVMGNATLNRGVAGFTYSAFNQQTLFAGPSSRVNVNALSGFLTATTIHSNDSTVNVGNGNLFNLAGAITVDGGSGTNDILNVNDSASAAARVYDVFRDRLVTSVGITVNYPADSSFAVDAVELRTGSGGDSITVHESDAARSVRIDAGPGNDEVYVGSGSLAALSGPVAAVGGPGTDGIRFDDARGAAFTDSVLTSSSFVVAGGPVHTYVFMERVTMLAGEAGSRTEVRSLSTPLSATGGPGDDVMLVGGGNSDANLAGAAVSFDGFSGDDRLELDDRLDVNNPAGGDNYLFDQPEIGFFDDLRKTGAGAADVFVQTFRVDTLVLHASDDPNSILVRGARRAVRINANGGNDDVAVHDVMPGGSVAVDTGTGADRLDVNADADGDDDIGAGNFPAAVTLDRSDEIGALTVRQLGTLRVPAGAVLTAVLTASPSTGFLLDGVIDLAGGALVLRDAAGGVEAVNALVKAGYHEGAWDGASNAFGSSLGAGAIHSSRAAAAPRVLAVGLAPAQALFGRFPASFLGQAIGPNDLVLRHTVVGDANLNGRVDAADVARLRRNLGRPNARWDQGNFNFDSATSLLDFALQRRNLR